MAKPARSGGGGAARRLVLGGTLATAVLYVGFLFISSPQPSSQDADYGLKKILQSSFDTRNKLLEQRFQSGELADPSAPSPSGSWHTR
jgi:hypothetical protein